MTVVVPTRMDDVAAGVAEQRMTRGGPRRLVRLDVRALDEQPEPLARHERRALRPQLNFHRNDFSVGELLLALVNEDGLQRRGARRVPTRDERTRRNPSATCPSSCIEKYGKLTT